MTAQILAAAPASLSGPATRCNCMPSPLVASLIMMTGRSACSGAFERDFSSPRHSARRPLTELALPRSTPNSVRCRATFGTAASSASSSFEGGTAATTSGIGLATTELTGLPGSISFVADGSGGAMNDFAATSGVAGVATSALVASTLGAGSILAGSTLAASSLATTSDFAPSLLAASIFSALPGSVFGGSLATDETVAGLGSGAVALVAGFSIAGAAVATGPMRGAGVCAAGGSRVASAGPGAAALGGSCRMNEPVTESSPCSRPVTREYSRSRSPFNVSTALARRRVSLWFSLAAIWICCA